MPQTLTNMRCAHCDIPLDAEYFDVSGFIGMPLVEDTTDLLVQMLKKEVSETMVYALRVDNNQDNIIGALRRDMREVIVKIPGGDDIKKMVADSLMNNVSTPILATLEAIIKKLETTHGKARTQTRGNPGGQTEKDAPNPGRLSAPELTSVPSQTSPALTAPPSLTEVARPKQQDALTSTASTDLIQTPTRSPVKAQLAKPALTNLFPDLKIGIEGLPRRGEQKVLASFQLHPQYCGVLTYFAQYTDLYARDNSQILTPGFEWVILQNGKPLFPYTRLEMIVNPWGNNCLPVAIRLDENALIEFVIRNRAIKDGALDETLDNPKYPIHAFAGRLMGRYWYNEIFGGRARSWRDS
ncbi:hypothetical protein L0337_25020 [candidate division KSB1 bacterium]|nr:hypothetical protein [candidate division KSB1 bacterium]